MSLCSSLKYLASVGYHLVHGNNGPPGAILAGAVVVRRPMRHRTHDRTQQAMATTGGDDNAEPTPAPIIDRLRIGISCVTLSRWVFYFIPIVHPNRRRRRRTADGGGPPVQPQAGKPIDRIGEAPVDPIQPSPAAAPLPNGTGHMGSAASTSSGPRVAAAPNGDRQPTPAASHPPPPGPSVAPAAASPRPLAAGDAFDAATTDAPSAQLPLSPRPFDESALAPPAPATTYETDLPLAPAPAPLSPRGLTTPAGPTAITPASAPVDGSSVPRRRQQRRRKPLPAQMALHGGDDGHDHYSGLRSLTLDIMAFTLRGRHRRPATNPTPTARHDVLLHVTGGNDGAGAAQSSAAAREGMLMSRSDGARAAGAAMEEEGASKMGMAATVAGCMPPTARAQGRRPRPLAIAGVEAHHYNCSTILPGRLLIGGEDVGGSEAALVRLGVKGVVNATRDGREEEKQKEGVAESGAVAGVCLVAVCLRWYSA